MYGTGAYAVAGLVQTITFPQAVATALSGKIVQIGGCGSLALACVVTRRGERNVAESHLHTIPLDAQTAPASCCFGMNVKPRGNSLHLSLHLKANIACGTHYQFVKFLIVA